MRGVHNDARFWCGEGKTYNISRVYSEFMARYIYALPRIGTQREPKGAREFSPGGEEHDEE